MPVLSQNTGEEHLYELLLPQLNAARNIHNGSKPQDSKRADSRNAKSGEIAGNIGEICKGEPMNEELNKELCWLLGICWHEHSGGMYSCACGKTFDSIDWLLQHIERCNPDFTTDSGKIQLLREMMKVRDLLEFLLGTDDDFVEMLIDNKGKFALTVRDFLRTTNDKQD